MSGEPDNLGKVDLVGQVVDQKYKVLALLGRGGMGAVYLAHHLRLNKNVALKTFVSASLSDDIRLRFKREAQSIAKLQQKNIVQIFDFGVADGGLPYYTMEHLDGESVSERLERKGVLDAEEALYVFSELCQGLAYCHKNGVIHRDIKPGNIFLELRSSTNDSIAAVKLVDFGIVTLTDNAVLPNQKLTAAGTVFGSPLYMSPEQSMGRPVDARADIYSSGCALFEMLTGKPPFRAASALATMLCHQEVLAPSLASVRGDRDYPQWLEALVARLLTKDPSHRLQSMDEALDIISSYERSDGHSSKSEIDSQSAIRPVFEIIMALGALFLLVGVGLVVYASWRPTEPVAQVQKKSIEPLSLSQYRLPARRKGFIYFRFPQSEIGKIGQGNDRKFVAACGDVEIPEGAFVFFRAGIATYEKPELLKGFAADDLHALIFDDDVSVQWNDRTAHNMEHLTSLKKVIFRGSKFSLAAVNSLNKLPNLVDLGLADSSLTTDEILKLNCLPRLQSLVVSGLKNVRPLLVVLAGSKNLFHLTAQNSHINDSDMAIVCTMHSLIHLNFEVNDVTAAGIKNLVKLSDLRELNLSENPIDTSALSTMLKLQPTMRVSMPSTFWTAKTYYPMAKRFGPTKVNTVPAEFTEKP